MNNPKLDRTVFLALALAGGLSAATLALPTSAAPAATGGQPFDSPQQAADAIVQAAAAGDAAAIEKILGPGGKDIVVSGDPVEDKTNLEKFAAKAKEKTSISLDPKDPKRA